MGTVLCLSSGFSSVLAFAVECPHEATEVIWVVWHMLSSACWWSKYGDDISEWVLDCLSPDKTEIMSVGWLDRLVVVTFFEVQDQTGSKIQSHWKNECKNTQMRNSLYSNRQLTVYENTRIVLLEHLTLCSPSTSRDSCFWKLCLKQGMQLMASPSCLSPASGTGGSVLPLNVEAPFSYYSHLILIERCIYLMHFKTHCHILQEANLAFIVQ